jgi:hypothetical protein
VILQAYADAFDSVGAYQARITERIAGSNATLKKEPRRLDRTATKDDLLISTKCNLRTLDIY